MTPAVHLNRTHRPERSVSTSASMGGALTLSTILHGLMFALTMIGMPLMAHDPMMMANTPMTVEIVTMDEVAKTKRVAPPNKAEKEPEEDIPAPAKPLAPKMTAEAPPDLTAPKAPEIEDVAQPRDVPPPPVPLEKKEPQKPKPKPEPPTKTLKPAAQDNKFNSLLKNLAPDADEVRSDSESPDLDQPDVDSQSQIAELGQQMTYSEQDALLAQLGQCWNVMAGAKYAEHIVVEVRVTINPDRTVRDAYVLNQGFATQDAHFRAAAEAALRALRHPNCTPLRLPEGKYQQWKTMTIRFDPREML